MCSATTPRLLTHRVAHDLLVATAFGDFGSVLELAPQQRSQDRSRLIATRGVARVTVLDNELAKLFSYRHRLLDGPHVETVVFTPFAQGVV